MMITPSLIPNWFSHATQEGQALFYCCHTNIDPLQLNRLKKVLLESFNWEQLNS